MYEYIKLVINIIHIDANRQDRFLVK